jgi:triphosphoribosyl-dephospho-CoA synthase
MAASVRLLPEYYADLLRVLRAGGSLAACTAAGRAAEDRMLSRIGTNAHRGYIFLSGLVLVALHRAQEPLGGLRGAVRDTAIEFFSSTPRRDSNGSRACRGFGVGGIRAEAEAGLPSVLERAWPRHAASLRRDGNRTRAEYYAMAALMQRVEDTTALHRCGAGGLARVRRDGRTLEALLDQERDPRDLLEECNEAYRRLNLTIGGVADCLALTIALQVCFGDPPARGPGLLTSPLTSSAGRRPG